MKYKVGDKVRIKNIDWYNENKNDTGYVHLRIIFTSKMSKYCGQVTTIIGVINNDIYKIALDNSYYDWTDEMIEGLVKDLPDKEIQEHQKICDEALTIKGIESTEEVWHCPEGYQFVDENGNVINTQKIILEKMGNRYPKTYEECCKMLGVSALFGFTNLPDKEVDLYGAFICLIRCRDAYWKIAGDKMELGRPWEPDWNTREPKYVIACTSNGIEKQWEFTYYKIFAFPTEEMRDAFFDNFKELIEICKELL